MSKTGPQSWTAQAKPAELQEIHEWIDSEDDYRAVNLYRHLRIKERFGIGTRSWHRYVKARRDSSQQRVESSVGLPSPPSWSQLDELTRSALGQALMLGKLPEYRLHNVLRLVQQQELVKIEQAAETRAVEIHAEKIKELRARQEAALEELNTETPQLTPEVVAQIRQRVLGLGV